MPGEILIYPGDKTKKLWSKAEELLPSRYLPHKTHSWPHLFFFFFSHVGSVGYAYLYKRMAHDDSQTKLFGLSHLWVFCCYYQKHANNKLAFPKVDTNRERKESMSHFMLSKNQKCFFGKMKLSVAHQKPFIAPRSGFLF